MIQIYCGDGKGKTSAAVGAAVRFAGSGGKVLFYQFMKDQTSGERKILEMIPQITVVRGYRMPKFSFRMNEEEKAEAGRRFREEFEKISEMIRNDSGYGMIIFDEIISCINAGFLDIEKVMEFLREYSENNEIILTGRNPSEEITEIADYISEIKKVKHPFDNGITARKGIEY